MRASGLVVALLLCVTATVKAQGMVSGRVFDDSTSCPLRGATISAQGHTAKTVTDAQGRYYLKGAPTSAFTLEVMLRGYVGTTEAGVVATDTATRVDFSLVRAISDAKPVVRYPAVRCVLDRRDSAEVRAKR